MDKNINILAGHILTLSAIMFSVSIGFITIAFSDTISQMNLMGKILIAIFILAQLLFFYNAIVKSLQAIENQNKELYEKSKGSLFSGTILIIGVYFLIIVMRSIN